MARYIKDCDDCGTTALHYACEYCQSLSTIQFLAQQWPEAVRIKAKGEVPLIRALRSDRTSAEIVAFLIDMWPEAVKEKSSDDADAETCLLIALKSKKNFDFISLLIDQWPDALQIPDQQGNMPLQTALDCEAPLAVLNLMVKTFPDALQIPNEYGELPLQTAMRRPAAVLDLLVKSYPESVRVKNRFGKIPLHGVLHFYMDRYRPYHRTDSFRVQILLECWPESILQRDKYGAWPLREALKCNFDASLAAIKLMVKTLPDAFRVHDRSGHSPLDLAMDGHIRPVVAAEYLHLIKLLVENWPESIEKNTLHRSCTVGRAYTDIIWYIFHLNPNAVRIRDYQSCLPLHILCARKTIPKKLVQRFVQEWPASVRVAGRYLKDSEIFTKNEIITNTEGNYFDLDEEVEDNSEVEEHSEDEEEYDGDDNGWDHDNLAYNKGCENSDQETHDHDYQGDNDNSDESENEENDTAISDDQHGKGNNNGDYIYALPLDVACAARERPSLELIRILTNGRPPLHFLCQYSRTPWIPTRLKAVKYMASILPNDRGTLFYRGALPFHWVCRSRAPRSVLEWWCEQYPTVVSARTSHTQELPLHCYLDPRGTDGSRETAIDVPHEQNCDDDNSYLSAVQFLVGKYPDALNCANRIGWLPLHLAAMQDVALDMLFYLLCQNPGGLQTVVA